EPGPSARPPRTIGEAAAAIGVSKATVSRALNGHGRIAPATRQRVLEALDAMGYVPSRVARSLSTGRTHLIGLSIGQTRDPTAVPVLEGALAAALPAGYAVAVYLTAPGREQDVYTDLALRDGVDGVLALYPTAADAAPLRRLVERGVPVVA